MIKQVNLIDICDPKQWKTISSNDLHDEGYPVYGANGKIGYFSKYTHEFPTVLITCRGATCGTINICEPKSYVNGNAMALDNLDSSVDLTYLFYVLKYRGFDDAISGSAQPQITRQNLKNVKIPMPLLVNQRKIAAILDAADSLRQKDQQLVERYTALSQSIFLEMFGDPVTNPMVWEKAAAIKYCECIVPGRDKPKSFTGEIPWVTTNDLNHLAFTVKSKSCIGLTTYEIQEVRARVIPEYSVILTCVGDLGVVSINTKPLVVNQQLHTFQCDNEYISPVFMMYALSHQKPYMLKMASSTTVPYMNKTVCNSIPMIYPPIALQNQFAERIQLIEAQKQQAKLSLAKSEALFNSLLQRAFMGELTAKMAA